MTIHYGGLIAHPSDPDLLILLYIKPSVCVRVCFCVGNHTNQVGYQTQPISPLPRPKPIPEITLGLSESFFVVIVVFSECSTFDDT